MFHMGMRPLCFVIKEFDPDRGGGEKFTYQLLSELKKILPVFKVVCMSVNPRIRDEFDVDLLTLNRWSIMPKSIRFNQAFREWHKEHSHYGIVALTQVEGANIYRAGGGIWKIWQEIQKQESPIKHLKSYFSMNRYAQVWLENRILFSHHLKCLVVNSELVRSQFETYYPHLQSRVFLIENGIDLGLCAKASQNLPEEKTSKPGKANELVFVSNNFERKGLSYVMLALKELPDFRLHVLGKGNIRKFSKMARDMNLEQRVVFKGSVKNVGEYLLQCDIFILPTQYDPCSNATIEALSMGLPVITTHMNGAAMYVKSNAGVVLNEHVSADSIRKAIVHVSSSEHFNSMKTEARNNVAHLNYAGTASQFLALFQSSL